jgi:hypothetical protein
MTPIRDIKNFSNWLYVVSSLVGVLTYVVYGSLNDAWAKPALIGISLYMFLVIPWYSGFSNRIQLRARALSGLETIGRLFRYLVQLGFNLVLLWVFVAGEILDPSGLEGIGGFFGAAAWVTVVSQGGQYLANWLAAYKIGNADLNVVLAISTSVIVNALAVSGVAWIQPVYVAISLIFGVSIFAVGIGLDARTLLGKSTTTLSGYRGEPN